MPDHALPYDQPTDPAKRHSRALTDGPDRAGARAMLKAVGFTDEDLAKPLVGVATTWIETMPCNLNQRRLAEYVKDGIRAAGGTPMEFNTIAVSDGVSMGTEGMKAQPDQPRGRSPTRSSSSSAATCSTASSAWSAATRRSPARRWPSAGSTSRASSSTTGRSIPGTYKGKRNATVVTVYEAIGAYRAGKISARRAVRGRERAPVPGPAPAAASSRPTR